MLTATECDRLHDDYVSQTKKSLALAIFTINSIYNKMTLKERQDFTKDYDAFMVEARKTDDMRKKWMDSMTIYSDEIQKNN